MKVAVIGVGYLGRFHAQKYAKIDSVELVGVCDNDKQRADKVASELSVKAFYDYKELANIVDCVSIVLPTKLHHKAGKFFLLNNVNVLIEKPITSTVKEADELIKIANQNNLTLQVGHLERFNPAIIALKKRLKKPLFIEIHRLSSFNPRGSDVNVVLDLMIHDIDIIQNLLKCEIKDIKTVGIKVLTNEIDICNARIEFINNCVVNVSASRVSNKPERKMRIFQENEYLIVDFQEKTLTIYKNHHSKDKIPDQSSIKSEILSFDNSDAIMDEILSFIYDTENCKKPAVSGEDGRTAILTALKITNKIKETNNAANGRS